MVPQRRILQLPAEDVGRSVTLKDSPRILGLTIGYKF
jgi:hypothetical protein